MKSGFPPVPLRRITVIPSSPPTDERLIAELRASDGAWLGTADLAERLGLHPNGVRVQLRRLAARGLVERDRAHGAAGRPPDRWRLSARAIAEADRPHVGWAMARSLARAIPATSARLTEIEAAGAELGAELARGVGVHPGEAPVDALDHALEAMGFAPERDGGEDGTVRYRLMSCPYADVVRENPAVVCTLHKGIVRGVLDQLGGGGSVTGFEPRDPRTAGCILEVDLGG